MATLLLRLAAPMQSYGLASKYEQRMTESLPTKSAVIGMIAAAFGWSREHDLSELTDYLRFGVRVDHPGQIEVDFHTAIRSYYEEGKTGITLKRGTRKEDKYITYRYYLHDAKFTVGLEGEEELLKKIRTALMHPYYPLFLGRRSCPPAEPMHPELVPDMDLVSALKSAEMDDEETKDDFESERIRLVYEPLPGEATVFWRDNPVTFSSRHRNLDNRGIKEIYYSRKIEDKEPNVNEHDPFSELGGRQDVHD
ncbi:MAG: type I-E CRISPR-associated protein Cas5/CasD [Aerococcus sp.]|nr:type I-E CRISPR-associated protein Cas5/CasD [Aerococcus sp.]